MVKDTVCVWEYDEELAIWYTECGKAFVPIRRERDDSEFKFCSECGKRVAAKEVSDGCMA